MIKIIITFFLIADFSYVNAQRTLLGAINQFDSICGNCSSAELNQLIYKASKMQDSLILQKKKLFLSRVGKRFESKDDSIYDSVIAGFDKLIEIENKNKKDVISIFRSLYSGSLLSYQIGIINYYFNKQTIDLLDFYIEINTE